MADIRLDHIEKYFGDVHVVKDLSLHIQDGSFTVLVGPSGCGKTTTLRLIAGLETVTSGKIFIGDQEVTSLEPKDRNVAMVFQNYALYPHMKVSDNIAFGLMARKVEKAEIQRRVQRAAAMLGIENLLERKPKQLSGGQQQRVAIGRAIVRNPNVFLFDEPLSNLDAKLRVEMRTELLKLHRELKATAVYVTHDQEEAMTMGDQIVVMESGVIQQQGAPREIYFHPRNLFVAGFIGSPAMNMIDGRLENGDFISTHVRIPMGLSGPDREVVLGVRPEDIHLPQALRQERATPPITAQVEVIELLGSRAIVPLRLSNQAMKAVIDERFLNQLTEGESVQLVFDRERLHLFDADSGERIA
jgi:multiple sugar transport system ATP-binding protein